MLVHVLHKRFEEAENFVADDAPPEVVVELEWNNTFGIVHIELVSVPKDVVLHVFYIRKRGFTFAACAFGYINS